MLQLKLYQQRTLNELKEFLVDTNKLVSGSKIEPEKALKLVFNINVTGLVKNSRQGAFDKFFQAVG